MRLLVVSFCFSTVKHVRMTTAKWDFLPLPLPPVPLHVLGSLPFTPSLFAQAHILLLLFLANVLLFSSQLRGARRPGDGADICITALFGTKIACLGDQFHPLPSPHPHMF